jgi:hypothetical protein
MADTPHARARALIEARDFAAAETLLSQLVISQPTDGLAWQLLGTALFRKRDSAGASIAYRRALVLEPNEPINAYGLALALKGLGQTDEAIGLLRRAIQLKPDFTQAIKRLSELERTQPIPAPPVRPTPAPTPSPAPAPPVFAVAPPAGAFVGQARSIQKTREDDAWIAQSHPITWTFRVDRKGPDGNELPPVPVRLTGGRIQGALVEGDWVAIPGPWKPGTTATPRKITNLTTGAPVEVKGKGSRWVQRAILITFLLLFAGFAFFVVSKMLSDDIGRPTVTESQNGSGGNNQGGGGGGNNTGGGGAPDPTPTETTMEPPPPTTITCTNTDGTVDATINAGETVTWTNGADESMELDFGEPEPAGFEPQIVDPGASYEQTFPDAGSFFSYTCAYSLTKQTGVVTVQ